MTQITFTLEVEAEGPELLEKVADAWRTVETVPGVKVIKNSLTEAPVKFDPHPNWGGVLGQSGTPKTVNRDAGMVLPTTLHTEKREQQQRYLSGEA